MRSGFYINRRQAAEKTVHVVRLAFFPCPISCERVERLRIICGFLTCVYCDTVSNEKSELSDILYTVMYYEHPPISQREVCQNVYGRW